MEAVPSKAAEQQQQQRQSLRAADDRFTPLWGALHRWRSHPKFFGGASFNKGPCRSTQSQLSRPMSSGHYTFVELGRPRNKLMHAYLTAMVNTINANTKIYNTLCQRTCRGSTLQGARGDPICIQETPSRSPGDTQVATQVSHHVCGRGRRHTGDAQEAPRQLQ